MSQQEEARADRWPALTRPGRGALLAHVVVVALLLAAFAIWNGFPLLYEDTDAYIGRLARAMGVGPDWLTRPVATAAGGGAAAAPPAATGQQWLAGRSVYWGLAAYAATLIAGYWGVVALNAVCAALAAALLWFRGLGQARAWPLYLVVATLCLASAVGPFVALLTPDILAGPLVLSMALLTSRWRELGRTELCLLVALAMFAAVSHDSLMILSGLLAILGSALGWRLVGGTRRWWLIAALAAPPLAGLFATLLFGAAATVATGEPPLRFPFLSARLASTPAGLDYLARACPSAGWALCPYRKRLPVSWTTFLFDTRAGVFPVASLAERRRMSGEQYRFAFALAADAPLQVSARLGADVVAQLITTDLEDLRQAEKAGDFRQLLPVELLDRMRKTQVWQDSTVLDRLHEREVVLSVSSAFFLLACLLFRRRLGLRESDVWLIVMVLAGVLLNALICGVLTSPWGRFQARLSWCLPLLALLLLAARLRGR